MKSSKTIIGVQSGLKSSKVMMGEIATSITPSSSASNYGRINETSNRTFRVDSAIPDALNGQLDSKYRTAEFNTVSYTAMRSTDEDIILRQMRSKRSTELVISVSANDVTDIEFSQTFNSLSENINYLCSRTRSLTWGTDSWRKVVIVIVADTNRVKSRVLDVLTIMGVYQSQLKRSQIDGHFVQTHIFEYTLQLSAHNHEVHSTSTPIQVIFSLTQNPSDLHRDFLFFNTFATRLKSEVCIIIRTSGSRLSQSSLYHVWKAFDRDPYIGGVCCQSHIKFSSLLLNPVVSFQNFISKSEHVLHKPSQSFLGFIHNITGPLSAYRYLALKGLPLERYLHNNLIGDHTNNLIERNAGDHIIGFEILTKKDESWTLKYIPAARIEIKSFRKLVEFVTEYSKIFNYEFFSILHSLLNWRRIFHSSHSYGRKVFLFFQFSFNVLKLIFQWFSIVIFRQYIL